MIDIKSKDEFLKIIDTDNLVVVDFHALWCGPCKMLAPVLQSIASERTEVKIIKIDIDEMQELAEEYNVTSVPTLKFFKNGKIIDESRGYIQKEKLLQKIDELDS